VSVNGGVEFFRERFDAKGAMRLSNACSFGQ